LGQGHDSTTNHHGVSTIKGGIEGGEGEEEEQGGKKGACDQNRIANDGSNCQAGEKGVDEHDKKGRQQIKGDEGRSGETHWKRLSCPRGKRAMNSGRKEGSGAYIILKKGRNANEKPKTELGCKHKSEGDKQTEFTGGENERRPRRQEGNSCSGRRHSSINSNAQKPETQVVNRQQQSKKKWVRSGGKNGRIGDSNN